MVGVGFSSCFASYAGYCVFGSCFDGASDAVYSDRSICSIEAETLDGKLLATIRVSRVGTHLGDHRVGLNGPAFVSSKITVLEC